MAVSAYCAFSTGRTGATSARAPASAAAARSAPIMRADRPRPDAEYLVGRVDEQDLVPGGRAGQLRQVDAVSRVPGEHERRPAGAEYRRDGLREVRPLRERDDPLGHVPSPAAGRERRSPATESDGRLQGGRQGG